MAVVLLAGMLAGARTYGQGGATGAIGGLATQDANGG